jgi:hypothetical protein
MRHSQRNLSLSLIILLLLGSGLSPVRAFQASGQTSQSQQQKAAASSQDPDPIAVTKRDKTETPTEAKEIGEGQFGTFGFPVINNKGEVAFIGRYPLATGTKGTGQAIFIKAPDGTWRIIRDTDKAANLSMPLMTFSNPRINDNGDVTFIGSLPHSAVVQNVSSDSTQGQNPGPRTKTGGVFVNTAAGLKNIVQFGQEVPRMPSIFGAFANASTNSKGTVAFIGTYSDPDGRGLFINEGDRLTIVARSGQKIAPNDESVFSEHYYPSDINERGEIAWFSRIGGPGGGGIFVKRETGIEAIAIQGQPTPIKIKAVPAKGKPAPAGGKAAPAKGKAAPAPAAYANYIGFGQIPPSINDKGDVAFVGFYDGPDAGRGLFIKEGQTPVKLLLKSGDNITGTTYNFTSFNNPSINNRGEIAFIGQYGGRSRGIFLKTAKGVETVALYEQKIPGGGEDELFNNFTQPSLNDRGEVVFYAQLRNGHVGIFIKDASGLRQLVMRGDKMPIK